jgi:hypothetical protein
MEDQNGSTNGPNPCTDMMTVVMIGSSSSRENNMKLNVM